jgi:prepilin-type N-terminal cleavage/methylation domain-containing protein
MNRRRGVTLIEVLVAIFVMALGLLTLLALFPLGVLTMEQAIQDDRAATAVENATALAIVQDIRHDPAWTQPQLGAVKPLYRNPNPAVFSDAPPDGPSYPVYLDPNGWRSYLPPYQSVIGGGQPNGTPIGVPRSTVSFVNSNADFLRWFTLLDDIQFDDGTKGSPAGTPSLVSNPPPTFERDNRYSWAYLVRRPMTGDPTVVELSVVVYAQRQMALNSSLQGDEAAFAATFDPSSNIVSIRWNPNVGQAPPNIRPGTWIMDTSLTPSTTQAGLFGPPHAYFYRVVGVTDTSATSMDVEVQTPLRGFPIPGAQQPLSGTIVVMEGVAEVFDKGTGWHP